jgi:hypothetical protein
MIMLLVWFLLDYGTVQEIDLRTDPDLSFKEGSRPYVVRQKDSLARVTTDYSRLNNDAERRRFSEF